MNFFLRHIPLVIAAIGCGGLLFWGAGRLPLVAQTAGSSKFIQTFLVYYGGGPAFVASDAQKLAKFDLIDTQKFFYNNLAPTTWAAVKALNPNVQIYLYEDGTEASNYQDT